MFASILCAAALCCATAPASAAPPFLRVGEPLPPLLDLRGSDPLELVPAKALDEAGLEAIRLRWFAMAAPFAKEVAVRLALPVSDSRTTLALAANQALKALNPSVTLYLAYDGQAPANWDDAFWGAFDGGAVAPGDLPEFPEGWPDLLAKAHELLPARPWTLWCPMDPGAWTAQLLGAGARLVVPPGGAAARLAASVPDWAESAEGSGGRLTFRGKANDQAPQALHWRYFNAEWRPVLADKERASVTVAGRTEYDVQVLLAKARATQLRDSAAIRTAESTLAISIHSQAGRGIGGELGYTFRSFEKAGEPEELLQEEVLFNGVKAKLHGGTQLPVIESKRSISPPVALSLTEMYAYSDGGPKADGQRWIRFAPAVEDATLFTGRVLIDESSGRILEEQSERSELPGVVKSESRKLAYGEPLPGFWRVIDILTFERWVMTGSVAQVRRELSYRDFRINQGDFDRHRDEARASSATMLRQTEDGMRYLARGRDGGRYIERTRRTSGRALGAAVLIDPALQYPVIPGATLGLFDYDAFARGVQYYALVAGLFNMGSISAPNLPGGFELGASAWGGFLPYTDLPVKDGKLQGRDGVSRQSGQARVNASRDLGGNFRLRAQGICIYNRYSEAKEEKYRTPGYVIPTSGFTLGYVAELSWLAKGFQLRGSYGSGRRPGGEFGPPDDVRRMADRYKRWGAVASYDLRAGPKALIHSEVGTDGGSGFDRFLSLNIGAGASVPGIRSSALSADRSHFASLGYVLPASKFARISCHVDHARARGLDDRKTYGFTGLAFSGDLPGFWWFTAIRADIGVGLQSDIPDVKGVNGYVALLRVF